MANPNHVELKPVKSSKLKALGYDSKLFILRAQFTPTTTAPDGARYDYFDVEPEKFADLMNAPSIGSYFGLHIAGKRGGDAPYKFAKLDTPRWSGLWEDARGPAQDALFAAGTQAVQEKPRVQSTGGYASDTGEASRVHPGFASHVDEDGPLPTLPRQANPTPAAAPVEVIPQVDLPSDQDGLTRRAEEVQKEVTQVLTLGPDNRLRLAKADVEGYKHVMALILAKKEEKRRALAEVAKIKDPATAAWKAACAFEKKVADSYDQSIAAMDQAATAWRRDIEAEERRAAEARRAEEQRRLDAEAERRTAEAAEVAKREADNLRAAGAHEVAAQVESAPLPVFAETAPLRVEESAVPAIAGSRRNVKWCATINNPELVPLFYAPHIAMALMRAGFTLPEDKLRPLAIELGRAFEEFHPLNEDRVRAKVRTLKGGAVGLIPGVHVYDSESTGSTGR